MEDRSKYGGYHHTCIGLRKDGPTRKSWHKDWTTRRGLDTERTDVKGKYILKSPYIPQDSHNMPRGWTDRAQENTSGCKNIRYNTVQF